MVRTTIFNKGKNHLVVQNVKDFAEVAKKYLEKTDVIFISEEQIHPYIFVHKPFRGTVSVPGIFNMHVIESSGIPTKLWKIYISNKPDITVPVTASEVAEPVPSSDFNELDDWVIVSYLFYIVPRVNLFYFS